MTVIAWDGRVLATDSKVTWLNTEKSYPALKIVKLDCDIRLSTNSSVMLSALAATGESREIERLTGALNSLNGKMSLQEFIQKREELGAPIPAASVCRFGFAGVELTKPIFVTMISDKLVLHYKPIAIGTILTPAYLYHNALRSSLEYVYVASILRPDLCGPDYFTYDPVTRALKLHTPAEIDKVSLAERLQRSFDTHLLKKILGEQ